jgi:glycine betaine/proline transport system substrate-binding protein
MLWIGGCGGSTGKKPLVRLAYVDWTESIGMTEVARRVLEKRLGVRVETKKMSLEEVFSSLARGESDAFLNAWLPTTHASFVQRYGGDLEDLGVSYEGARIGLAAPVYVPFETVGELARYKEELGGEIVGIDPDSGVMAATRKAIENYDLDFKLTVSSSRKMTTRLGEAIQAKKWIVVTAWSPHWKFHRWRLKWLADPKGVFPPVEAIHTVARRNLGKDLPRVVEFLRRMRFDQYQLPSLLDAVLPFRSDPGAAVEEWLVGEQALVDGWFPASSSPPGGQPGS